MDILARQRTIRPALRRTIIAVLGAALGSCAAIAQITVTPQTVSICQGGSVHLKAVGTDPQTANWTLDDPLKGVFGAQKSATTTFTASPALAVGQHAVITATAGDNTADRTVTIASKPCLGGEIVRAVVGLEQVGASATPSSQSFVFDFFISRPVPLPGIPKNEVWGSRLRWWGDIKVSSYPYTQKSSIANVAQQFSSVFGSQNLNQFAESIEFVTGPEVRIFTSGSHGSLTDENSAARFGLTWFAGVGATGPNNPTDNATVFLSPVAGSSQDTLLTNMIPQISPGATFTACPAASGSSSVPPTCTNYLAFVPKTGDRFLQQWQTGFRLYTLFTNKPSGEVSFSSPATIEFSFGQNEAVTESELRGLVLHVAGMYPFSIGNRGASGSVIVYLFGEVESALARDVLHDSLILSPALDSNGNPISVSNPTVSQIPVVSNRRDTYRLGVGIDLMSVLTKLTAAKSANQ